VCIDKDVCLREAKEGCNFDTQAPKLADGARLSRR
jgi:hypothetical protein